MAFAVLTGIVPRAAAHPLGNYTVNHLSTVRISDDRVEVRYVLDEAEIPTVQNQRLSKDALIREKREDILGGLALKVEGRQVALQLNGAPRLTFLPGQAGLETTRLELDLRAGVDGPQRVELRDETFPNRTGLKSIVVEAGDGTAVRSTAPGNDPTEGLRRYPQDILKSPLNRTEASFRVREGDGTLVALPHTAVAFHNRPLRTICRF